MEQLITNIIADFENQQKGLSFQTKLNANTLRFIVDNFGEDKLQEIASDVESLFAFSLDSSLPLPKLYYQFLAALIGDCSQATAFDPWLLLSSPLLNMKFKAKKAICAEELTHNCVQRHFHETKIDVEQGFLLDKTEDKNLKSDYIISNPPYFHKSTKPLENSTSKYFLPSFISTCSEYLNEAGKIIITVPPSFFYDQKGKVELWKKGIRVSGMFLFPSNSLLPITSLDLYVIILEKGEQNEVFFAQLQNQTLSAIVNNFQTKRNTKLLETGTLINIEDFKGLKSWKANNEVNNLSRTTGLEGYTMSSIVQLEKIPSDCKSFDQLQIETNTVFIPLNSLKEAFSTPIDSTSSPKNYIKLSVDDEVISKTYFINYLNSHLGILQRESVMSGSSIPSISITDFLNLRAFIPERKIQDDILSIGNRIEELELELKHLKVDLWKKPKKTRQIEKALGELNNKENLENWIDKLPFPLSSILWRYYAASDPKEKVDHLLNFFEALAEFIAVTLLSALIDNEDLYHSEKHNWLDHQEKYKNWYLSASFGGWNSLNFKLAKVVRTQISKEDTKAKYFEVFGNPSEEFMQMITSREIGNLLNEAASLRNKWKGHPGIMSAKDHESQSVVLAELLNKVRRNIGNGFEGYSVINPSTSEFEKGIYSYKVKLLQGARTPFNEVSIRTVKPLDKKKLYSIHNGSLNPIELISFIKYDEEFDAVYFYSRAESRHVRWVSYHFEKKSELILPQDEDIDRLFGFLS